MTVARGILGVGNRLAFHLFCYCVWSNQTAICKNKIDFPRDRGVGRLKDVAHLVAMTLKECIDAVGLFHKTYGLRHESKPTIEVSIEEMALRHRLMAEENDEYLDAVKAGDIVEVADALGDMLYILCGTMVTHGMQDVMADVFRTIQDSNMSKLGPDGKPIYREDGKVMKGPNYFRPDISGVLARWGVELKPEPS